MSCNEDILYFKELTDKAIVAFQCEAFTRTWMTGVGSLFKGRLMQSTGKQFDLWDTRRKKEKKDGKLWK